MATDIKCPNCGNVFDVENVLATDIEQKLQQQYQEKLKQSLTKVEDDRKKLENDLQQFEEKKKKENEIFAQRLQQERIKLETEIQEQTRKSISSDYENKLRLLEDNNKNNEEKLKESRKKELEFLQKEQALKEKETELELSLQRKLMTEREKIKEQLQKDETDKISLKEQEHQLVIKEFQKKLDDQNKLVEEMRRKSEQGSMQLQGEAQELLLEQILQENFPFDVIEEVGKGVEGADCIQVIRNSSGKECGKIIYESKRTKNWSNTWIDKLKADMRNRNADMAVLVTQALPKDMERFGEKDGVWVCSFNEVASIAYILRNAIIEINKAQRSQENKGDKMQMLYDYLISNEFRGQMEAIVEGLIYMKQGIDKERIQMEKTWKEREKQLQKVIINTSGMYGSVKGIAGASISDIPLLDGSDETIDQ